MSTPTLLEAAKALLEDCKETLRDGGGCDHSVGICWCANIKRIEQAESAIAAEEAKKPEAWALSLANHLRAAFMIDYHTERAGAPTTEELAAIIARHAPSQGVNELLPVLLREYLNHPSLDGHPIRQKMRNDLKELLESSPPSLERSEEVAQDARAVLARYDAQQRQGGAE